MSVLPSDIVAFPKVIAPVEVPPINESPRMVIAVLSSPNVITPLPSALTVPETLIVDGAVAVTPAVKVRVELALPRVTLPVFRKLQPFVTVPPAFRATSYPWTAVVKVPSVTAPLKIISCPSVVSVRVRVVALTVEENVAPLEFVIVSPVRVVEPPTAPPTVIEPPDPAFNPKV